MLLYVHGKQMRSCRDVGYPNHAFPEQTIAAAGIVTCDNLK